MKSNHDHIETEDLNEDENLSVIGRRRFLSGSVSLGAAVLGAGVLAGTSAQNCARPPMCLLSTGKT